MLQSECQSEQPLRAVDVLKDPYVLEFLDLPTTPQLHESQLEDAIITRLRVRKSCKGSCDASAL
jgi:predicted nuclease of restriction endonuclease-like (RecB) superfamily